MSRLISMLAMFAVGGICEAKVTQVSLFKNGLAFVNEQVTVGGDSGQFSFVPAAAPSHGSLWVSYSPEMRLESLVAEETNVPGTTAAANMAELLRANIGKRVNIKTNDNEELEGSIRSMQVEAARPQPYAMGTPVNYQDGYNQYRGPVGPVSGMVVTIESGGQFIALAADAIRRVRFSDEPKAGPDVKSARLTGRVGKGGGDIDVSYLCKGMTWAPSYVIAIKDTDGNAPLSAKAEVMNEIADMEGVGVQLITGYPNLQFAQIFSPIAKKEDLAQFLAALGRGSSGNISNSGYGGVMSNVTRQAVYNMKMAAEQPYEPSYGQAEQGVTAEDLFFYPLKSVSLKKGQVGYFPLFTEDVAYKHLYTWEIPDKTGNRQQYNNYNDNQNRPEDAEEVWHCLKLTNNMKLPWTTAPAQIMSSGMIIGQDTLNYTPVSGDTKLKITIASSIKAQQREIQLERQRNAAQFYGNSFDLVKVKGMLSVTNYQSKAINMEITKKFSGDLKSTQPEAKADKLPAYLGDVNNRGLLVWNLKLEAGQKQELEYVYEVYVRQ
ncbi:MAG: hypothetical protein A2Y07_01040 [Planctomycetes bacterium GWF2_50_10]|nr:MAG: hypothetical protein A2Y07_01040 [Planctomycetes bacterium GWF2_50_10]